MANQILKTCLILFILSAYSCKENKQNPLSNEAKIVPIGQNEGTRTFNRIVVNSVLHWDASHWGGIDPRIGKINYQSARVLVNNRAVTNASVSIDMSKISIDNLPEDGATELVNHLKTDDFFDIANYPTSQFELTGIQDTKGDYNSRVTGNLTILGISNSVSFNANILIMDNEVSIVSEKFTIDRSDWGMTYNAKGTIGLPLDYLISDDIGFQINLVVSK